MSKKTSILPRGSVAGPALGWVTATMCFLSCLALGAALMVDTASRNWLSQASGAVTVQITETRTQTAAEQLPAVKRILSRTPGVKGFMPLPQQQLIEMLEPWLGTGNVTDDLPIPILIEVTRDPQQNLNARALSIELKAIAPGAKLDTHGRWRDNLERGAYSLRLLAGLILVLVTIATATVIVFATRAGLATNRATLEVLHLIGAHDRFIARQFERHFLSLSFWACSIGYAAAAATFYVSFTYLPNMHGGLFFIWLTIVPVGSLLVTWIIIRNFVMRVLAKAP